MTTHRGVPDEELQLGTADDVVLIFAIRVVVLVRMHSDPEAPETSGLDIEVDSEVGRPARASQSSTGFLWLHVAVQSVSFVRMHVFCQNPMSSSCPLWYRAWEH